MDIKGVFKNFTKKIVENIPTTEKIKFKDSDIFKNFAKKIIDNMTVVDDIKIKGDYSIGKGSRKIKPSVVSDLKKYSPIGVGAFATYEGGKAIGNKDSEEEYRKKVIEEILKRNQK